MPRVTSLPLHVSAEVSDAIASGTGVVALESTIISHGLPTESAAGTAREIEDEVRRAGAVPATIAVVDGVVRIGLDDDLLVRVAEDDDVVKTSIRDLGVVMSRGLTGATTVAATSHLANLAGIRVFATGGLGGVHRGARDTWDESADLDALAQVPVTVVCAGVKSILDVPATLERLESLSVAVIGFGTDTFPGFYIRDTGLPVPWRMDTVDEVAAAMGQRDLLGLRQGMVVANPIDAARGDGRPAAPADAGVGDGRGRPAGHRRQGRDAVPARVVPRPDRRGQPEGQRRAGARQRRPGRTGSRAPDRADRRALEGGCAPDRERLTARGRSQRLQLGPGAATARCTSAIVASQV